MPWRPLFEICREVEQLPLRLTSTAATELTGALARRLGVNPPEISRAALLEATRLAIPENLEAVMRLGAREMKWLASGRCSADGKREVIHPDRWAFLTLDIERQAARDLDGKVVYADLRGAFGNDLTEEEWQSVELQLAPPSPAPDLKAGTAVPTAVTPQPDAETPETRREKQARETKEKYKRWYKLAQEIKKEGKRTHPTEIASAIAKREEGSTERGVNALNIKRRLDEHYSGWSRTLRGGKLGGK